MSFQNLVHPNQLRTPSTLVHPTPKDLGCRHRDGNALPLVWRPEWPDSARRVQMYRDMGETWQEERYPALQSYSSLHSVPWSKWYLCGLLSLEIFASAIMIPVFERDTTIPQNKRVNRMQLLTISWLYPYTSNDINHIKITIFSTLPATLDHGTCHSAIAELAATKRSRSVRSISAWPWQNQLCAPRL